MAELPDNVSTKFGPKTSTGPHTTVIHLQMAIIVPVDGVNHSCAASPFTRLLEAIHVFSIDAKGRYPTSAEPLSHGQPISSTEKELDEFFDQAKLDADSQHPNQYQLSTVERQLLDSQRSPNIQSGLFNGSSQHAPPRAAHVHDITNRSRTRSEEGSNAKASAVVDLEQQVSARQHSRTARASSIPRGVGAQFDQPGDPNVLRNLECSGRVDTVEGVRCPLPEVRDGASPEMNVDGNICRQQGASSGDDVIDGQDWLADLDSASDMESVSTCSQPDVTDGHPLSVQDTHSSRSGYTSASPCHSHANSTNLSAITSATTPNSSESNSHGQGRKRSRQDQQDNDNVSGNDNKLGSKDANPKPPVPKRERPLACFFNKRHPLYFCTRGTNHSKYRTCEHPFKDTQALTQHLDRVHGFRACVCPKCFEKFSCEKEVTTHLRTSGCQTRPLDNMDLEMWLARGWDAWLRLVKVGKKKLSVSSEKHWCLMWNAIFENETCPSAYFEPVQPESRLVPDSQSDHPLSRYTVLSYAQALQPRPVNTSSNQSGTQYSTSTAPMAQPTYIYGRGTMLDLPHDPTPSQAQRRSSQHPSTERLLPQLVSNPVASAHAHAHAHPLQSHNAYLSQTYQPTRQPTATSTYLHHSPQSPIFGPPAVPCQSISYQMPMHNNSRVGQPAHILQQHIHRSDLRYYNYRDASDHQTTAAPANSWYYADGIQSFADAQSSSTHGNEFPADTADHDEEHRQNW